MLNSPNENNLCRVGKLKIFCLTLCRLFSGRRCPNAPEPVQQDVHERIKINREHINNEIALINAEISEILKKYETKNDCRFLIFERENGYKIFAAFDYKKYDLL